MIHAKVSYYLCNQGKKVTVVSTEILQNPAVNANQINRHKNCIEYY